MASGAVDKVRWAAAVRRLMEKHAGGRKATFAKLVGVDPRTITYWLDQTFVVREATVRQVADKTGESAIELLVEVGVYTPGDLSVASTPEDEWIITKINSSGIPDAAKAALIAIELERARRERVERSRHIEEQIGLLGGSDRTPHEPHS